MVQEASVVSSEGGETIQLMLAYSDVLTELMLHRSWVSLAGKRPLPRKLLGAPSKEAKSPTGQVVPILGAVPAMPGTWAQHKPSQALQAGAVRQEGKSWHLPSKGSLEAWLGIVPCLRLPGRTSSWCHSVNFHYATSRKIFFSFQVVEKGKLKELLIHSNSLFQQLMRRFSRLSDVSSKLLKPEVTVALSKALALC